jgi:hypothetical protein
LPLTFMLMQLPLVKKPSVVDIIGEDNLVTRIAAWFTLLYYK